jgi:serine/threonine protein kinase
MVTCSASSLLERRGRRLPNHGSTLPPLLPSLLPSLPPAKKIDLDVAVEVLSDSTSAPSASASPWETPDGTPKVIPVKITSQNAKPLGQRQRRSRPSINCDLVLQEQLNAADPFANASCSRLEEEYEGFEKLGEGSCGVVYKVRARASNEEVAIKVMRMDDVERLHIAQKEYDMLRHVSHPHVIRALDFFTYSMGAVLVMDYFAGKKLANAVREAPNRHFQEPVAKQLCGQLLGAIAHLHANGIIHRDIKADNILVSSSLDDLRVVDFNAAKRLSEGQALTMTGTADYMPPEVLLGNSPSQAGDVWAAGLCLYLMLDSRLPAERRALRVSFDSLDEVPLHSGSLVQLDCKRWELISEGCKEVVRECLKFCCDARPTASELLAMPWFSAKLPTF